MDERLGNQEAIVGPKAALESSKEIYLRPKKDRRKFPRNNGGEAIIHPRAELSELDKVFTFKPES